MSLNDLRIPVNPEYDWSRTPDDQPGDYVNPVELNNKVVQYTNALIELTDRIQGLQLRRAEERIDRKRAEARVAQLRQDILQRHPAPTADRKSNALLDAYVGRMAHETGLAKLLGDAEDHLARAEEAIERTDAELEACRQQTYMLKDAMEGIRTHLAVRKFEHQLGR